MNRRSVFAGLVLLLACDAGGIVSVPADSGSRTIVASVGQEIQITLGNVGPAEYESPPRISSGVVTYLGVDVIPPYNPGGPTQRFRFKAVGLGEAIIDFRRLLGDSVIFTVHDTIQAR
jgi:hypothetical protein